MLIFNLRITFYFFNQWNATSGLRGGIQEVLTTHPPFEIDLYFFICGKENIMTSHEEGSHLDPPLLIFYLCFT